MAVCDLLKNFSLTLHDDDDDADNDDVYVTASFQFERVTECGTVL